MLNDLSVHHGDNKPSIEAIAVLVTLHKSLFVKVKENLYIGARLESLCFQELAPIIAVTEFGMF